MPARSHRILESRDRRFFELEIGRPGVRWYGWSWRRSTRDDRRRERGRAHMKERAAAETVRHPGLLVEGVQSMM
jgi:hypothetical protein